jgi:hypothetical protein
MPNNIELDIISTLQRTRHGRLSLQAAKTEIITAL